MTLDEAIKHCLEVAGEQQERADSAEMIDVLDGLDVEACKECAADHRQLAEWLTELKEAEWIDIKDSLPDIGRYVLIYYPYWTGNEIQVAQLCYDKLIFDICGEFNVGVNKVTHWRPLPKPPKQ